jgi:hypothetical protein
VASFEKLEIGRTKEFQTWRTFHQPRFPTADGKANLHVHELPELSGVCGELRLMTVRSEGQFNTVVYEEEDIYRGRSAMSSAASDDCNGWGLQRSTCHCAKLDWSMDSIPRALSEIPRETRPYYPVNVLVPRHADPQSRTPAFKALG